jgi:hypothetical protein
VLEIGKNTFFEFNFPKIYRFIDSLKENGIPKLGGLPKFPSGGHSVRNFEEKHLDFISKYTLLGSTEVKGDSKGVLCLGKQ